MMTVHRLWPERGPLVVAVSGGMDSVVLLRALHPFAEAAGTRLIVAHANHQLRGKEADGDAEFVGQLAAELGLPFFTTRLAVRREAERTRESIEMSARRLRHAFLARTAREHGATHIALAHHAGDQAELFFLRLFRGAGGDGLGGMHRCSPSPADPAVQLIRPLLDAPRELIHDFAHAEHVEFREDSSNADRSILRNRIRHELLPLLRRDFAPAMDILANRTSDLVSADAEFVRLTAQRWLAAKRRTQFVNLHAAVQRAVVREQLWALGHEPDFELVERLRQTGRRVSLDGKFTARRGDSGTVTRENAAIPKFQTGTFKMSLRGQSGAMEFASVKLTWARTRQPGSARKHPHHPGSEQFDAGKIGRTVTLRHWQPGDRFQPLGFAQPARLQDLFVNRKIPAARRRGLLLAVTASGSIFWVEGLPPGEAFKLTSNTRTRLLWRWTRAA